MEQTCGKAQCIRVMDRGMISEKNIAMLPYGGRRYIIGSPKSSLNKALQHLHDRNWKEVHDGVEVKTCQSPDHTGEVFILCKSRIVH